LKSHFYIWGGKNQALAPPARCHRPPRQRANLEADLREPRKALVYWGGHAGPKTNSIPRRRFESKQDMQTSKGVECCGGRNDWGWHATGGLGKRAARVPALPKLSGISLKKNNSEKILEVGGPWRNGPCPSLTVRKAGASEGTNNTTSLQHTNATTPYSGPGPSNFEAGQCRTGCERAPACQSNRGSQRGGSHVHLPKQR